MADAHPQGARPFARAQYVDKFRSLADGVPEVLRQLTRRLTGQLRAADTVSRHGGEEFLVALPGLGLREACAAIDNARAVLARQVLRRADDGASLGRVRFSWTVWQTRMRGCRVVRKTRSTAVKSLRSAGLIRASVQAFILVR